MWVVAEYQPTTLFSLRPATATTSGGKSLLVPTPFAIKMALLDAAIRTQGLSVGRELFPAVRDLKIALRPPARIVVNNTFCKIQRLKETKSGDKTAAEAQARARHQWPFQTTIAYREYAQFGGAIAIALAGMDLDALTALLVQINYLGKRGGFMQLLRAPLPVDEVEDFTLMTESTTGSFPLGVMQLVDDMGPAMAFDQADVYSPRGMKLGKDRVMHHVVLPYRMVHSSRGYSLYERF